MGFYAFERAVADDIESRRAAIKKLDKAGQSTKLERGELEASEKLLRRIRRFLSTTHVPFVIYVDSVEEDGSIKGLPLKAERRLYIEGNALNTLAGKEEVLKFESFSPVILALQAMRLEFDWMLDPIEEDSKSIGANSNKVFTLSALAQAFSFSVVGHNQPIKKVDAEMFDQVGERVEFVKKYWATITSIFGPVWNPEFENAGERLEYLKEQREAQHVAFTAIFLQALGKLGFALGQAGEWHPDSAFLKRLRDLHPDKVNYFARKKSGKYDDRWKGAMMKESNRDGQEERYVFNNVTDSVVKTERVLSDLIDFEIEDEVDSEDDEFAHVTAN